MEPVISPPWRTCASGADVRRAGRHQQGLGASALSCLHADLEPLPSDVWVVAACFSSVHLVPAGDGEC